MRDRAEPAVVIERHSGGVGNFLLGIAIGAGIALLFAPQTGEDARAEVRRTARRVKRKARDIADTGRDAVEDIARTGKSAARDARSAIEDRLARHRERAGTDGDDDGEDDGV